MAAVGWVLAGRGHERESRGPGNIHPLVWVVATWTGHRKLCKEAWLLGPKGR